MLHRCLSHAEGEAPVDRRAHGYLVEKAAVDTDDRYRSEVATAVDGLPQHVRPVGAHEGGDLHTINDRVEAGCAVGLSAHCVSACVRASAVGQFLDPVVN